MLGGLQSAPSSSILVTVAVCFYKAFKVLFEEKTLPKRFGEAVL